MTNDASLPRDADGAALDRQLAVLEASVYRSLHGASKACDEIASRADALGLAPQALRARLLASDVHSRLGHVAEAHAQQLALHEATRPWPMLAARAAMYLVSTCHRLGQRVEAMRWVEASVCADTQAGAPAWHAEALMVAAMYSMSRAGADYTLVEHAMAAVRAACDPVLVAVTAANFAEVAAECGELTFASHYADVAVATMLRHPEAAAVLSWESVARARLASSEIAAAEHAMRESMRLELAFGCSDVNGDPWLTQAEVMLARGDAAGALAMLDHPRRGSGHRTSSWTHTRDLRMRARVLAALQRWEEAYQRMVEHAAAYEHARSIEGDRAVAESSAAVAVVEERRRSQQFERLSLTDPLTGLPNRRHAERWLAEQAGACDPGAASDQLCVAIADLDHFKSINDTHSHDAGDLVLKRVATLLSDTFNKPGSGSAGPMLAARLGGEEFLLAWSGTSIEAALRAGNALCERLRKTSFKDIAPGLPVTASLGLACGGRPVSASALLHAADKCLYEAKRAGRDRVIATQLPR